MININYLIKKFLKILLFTYIFSLIFHSWQFYSLRISEIIFLIILLLTIIAYHRKIIFIKLESSDLIIFSFLFINIILFFIIEFSPNRILGLIVSAYLFFVYFLFKNFLQILDFEFLIKFLTLTITIGSLLGILGWITYQFDIPNILALERNYPFFIGKPVLARGFYSTPNLLAFSNIIGIFLIIIFENKKIFSKIKLFVLLLGLFLTFSKMIVLFLGLIILFFTKSIKNKSFKALIIASSIFLIFIHSFLTNFLIIDKNKKNDWLDNKYTHTHIQPVYENNKVKIILTNYYFLKEKSYLIAKENFLVGIGYENFKKQTNYPILNGQKPHSTYFGVLAEYGFLGLISVLIILFYNFYFSYLRKKNFLYIIILFAIFFGIDADLLTLKLIWIIFSINIYSTNLETKSFCNNEKFF